MHEIRPFSAINPEDLGAEFNHLINMLRRRAIAAKMSMLQFDLKEAEQAADRQKISLLVSEFNNLTTQLNNINTNGQENKKVKEETSI